MLGEVLLELGFDDFGLDEGELRVSGADDDCFGGGFGGHFVGWGE